MLRTRGIVVALLAAAAMSRAVDAQTVTGNISRITRDAATSGCIGSSASPLCATETLLACFARGDLDLCRKLGLDAARVPANEAPVIEYVVERVSIIRQENITDDLRELDWFKPGFALVELQRRMCGTEPDACESADWYDMQVYLRPTGATWEVVTWRDATERDGAPEIPDAFLNR
ncbi:MAG TPA: hypothetical protein VF342_17555 [Alphaproteobacteria bacterium]